jgi:methyltransferase (TIGR00027 family)
VSPREPALFQDVTETAGWIAAYRAIETSRPDALFRDRLAASLAGEEGRRLAGAVDGAKNFEWMIALRTVIVDDLVTSALGPGVDTVVNLGAGMDARPYRLPLPPALRWIEADHPRIVGLKDRLLRDEKPACRLERIGVDLSHADERRALFDRIDASSERALVVTEGVIGYLTNAEVNALAIDLRRRRWATRWIVDRASPLLRRAMRGRSRVRSQFRAAPFRFDPPDWDRFFRDAGWEVATVRYAGEEGERHGRRMPMPVWLRWATRLSRGAAREVRRLMAFVEIAPRPEDHR